jgi:hypothetical protein
MSRISGKYRKVLLLSIGLTDSGRGSCVGLTVDRVLDSNAIGLKKVRGRHLETGATRLAGRAIAVSLL